MAKLKEIRLSKNMTQIDVAKAINVKQVSVSQWETGVAIPRSDTLIKLARLFGCTVDELLTEQE